MHHFQNKLLAWYAAHKRDLPWRGEPDPYRVWISEIMLQQTQVERVKEFYRRFLERFPTVESLAEASWEDLLERWRGLGYYNRARNLQKAAQAIVAQHGGLFPKTLEEARALPGVGPYTAGAILSIAYNLDEPALDANIRRVLQRWFGKHPLDEASQKDKVWWELAGKLLPQGQAGDWNQALMDFGAQICSARTPACGRCPVREGCSWRKYLDQHPEAESQGQDREKVPRHALQVAAAIVHLRGRFLVCRRPQGKAFAGLWEFPGGKRKAGEDWRACLKREIMEELGVEVAVGLLYDRLLHHYDSGPVLLRFYRCTILSGELHPHDGQEIRWATAPEMADLPFLPADTPVIERLMRGSGL